MENVELLADPGFLGSSIDEAYGGWMTEFEPMLTVDVIGRVCPDTLRSTGTISR